MLKTMNANQLKIGGDVLHWMSSDLPIPVFISADVYDFYFDALAFSIEKINTLANNKIFRYPIIIRVFEGVYLAPFGNICMKVSDDIKLSGGFSYLAFQKKTGIIFYADIELSRLFKIDSDKCNLIYKEMLHSIGILTINSSNVNNLLRRFYGKS